MSTRQLVRTWYRSLTPDGHVWCESSDFIEVQERSKGMNCRFEIMQVYEVTTDWIEWST